MAVGQGVIPFCRAADAHIIFDNVVIGRQVFVGEWPVFAVTIVRGGFEIQVAQAVALAAPNQRSPADDPQPLPGEGFSRGRTVRVLHIVHEPVVVVLHARVALLLHGPRARDLR